MSKFPPHLAPRWLDRASQDMGLAEIPGAAANERIIGYWRAIGRTDVSDDETAWCAVWASAILEASGVPSPRSAAAMAFLEWGVPLERPVLGCIVVTRRHQAGNPKAAHVGFLVDVDWHANKVQLLSGNQGDKVSEMWFPVDQVVAYRWPATEPLPMGARVWAKPLENTDRVAAPPADPSAGGKPSLPPAAPPASPSLPASRLQDFRQSKTVLGALLAAAGLVVQWGSGTVDWLLQAAAAIGELGPLKAALLEAGANARAAGFAIGVFGVVLVLQRRLIADSKVPAEPGRTEEP